TNIMFVLSGTVSNSPELSMKCESFNVPSTSNTPCINKPIEEADTRMLPHIVDALKNNICRVSVISNDTDVFVMVLHYAEKLKDYGASEIWIRAGIGDSTRYLPMHTLALR
ncbi:unnamed protein product, partial [Owenia fusiformis]